MKTKEEKIKLFDVNAPAGEESNLFGLPFKEEECEVIIIPVPWEVTVSYRSGTANAPEAILEASKQVDLNDYDFPDAWKRGFFLRKPDKKIRRLNKWLRKKAERYMNYLALEGSVDGNVDMEAIRDQVNDGGKKIKKLVREEALKILDAGKTPALLGGDHSTPLGFIEALATRHPSFAILQIDAHCDLRKAYEGFEYSHASIMYNALQIQQVSKLVQVGIRDYCKEEADLINNSQSRVVTFFDAEMKRFMYEGNSWANVCKRIVDALPEKIYISFDIDGLDPKLSPNTGTPVPGGLEFEQAIYLFLQLKKAGKKIIGFDLNEVAPGKDDWDANVGARLLFKLCGVVG